MTDPISAISFAAEMFSMALDAYKLFRKALAFPDSAEKLVLRLKVEYVRLQLWGRNSGLDRGQLPLQFRPFEDLILDVLKRLTMLFQDSTNLRKKYGLLPVVELPDSTPNNTGPSKTQRTASFMRIKQAWKGVAKLERDGSPALKAATQPEKSTIQAEKPDVSFQRRLRWAISSQSHFEQLILEIRGFTDSLNSLLRESQQLTLSHDWGRVQLAMLAGVEDAGSLQLVQATTEGYRECEDIFDMATRKAIVVGDSVYNGLSSESVKSQVVGSDYAIQMVHKADFDLPSGFRDVSRCLARYKNAVPPSNFVIIEKKRYPAELSAEHRESLRARLKALLHLLNSSDRDRQSLPRCMGYWHEPEDSCWCLVYVIPSSPSINGIARSVDSPYHLLTLLDIIRHNPVIRPPLEHRIQLASDIAGVLSRLFGSQWLHKSIRSDNIVFCGSRIDQDVLSNSPLILGFEYSRQYTELASIDLVDLDLAQSLYRHPEYQGNERDRKKYRIAYDVYSFGLMLAEIALWTPVLAIYQERLKRHREEQSRSFLEPQAMILREEVIKIVERQLAFKIGLGYRDVVLWCLRQTQASMITDKELAAEFYSKVVVPLETISRTFR
ncbi:prion-inhibition and propagation-domain-containing protein [Lentinula raphanica]|nr:prion-inhibition and propagation-domain-containing protein [Lentinula raphanica]KAJ3968655.1 prion-inhibition and propagation-domain-containing protein [Lentinula raphanica]